MDTQKAFRSDLFNPNNAWDLYIRLNIVLSHENHRVFEAIKYFGFTKTKSGALISVEGDARHEKWTDEVEIVKEMAMIYDCEIVENGNFTMDREIVMA